MASHCVVNVASVQQYSPFRYPGGKTWLVPRIRQWAASRPACASEFVEPFAGGAIISLTVAAENLAAHITLVELDEVVAGVWQTIINDEGGGEWLAERIVRFDLTPESVAAVLKGANLTAREQAFQTILKNRVHRGGILAPGAGLLKEGEGGKGLRSRWYPETLSRRILNIVTMREHTTFVAGDGLEIIERLADAPDTLFFLDPPYTVAGKRAGSRLYTYPTLDHEKLFRLSANLTGDFLMTYDDTEEVRALARRHGFDTEVVAMKNTHHARMTELLIGRDLDWVRR